MLQEARYHHLQNCFGYVEESTPLCRERGLPAPVSESLADKRLFLSPGLRGAGISGKVAWLPDATAARGVKVILVSVAPQTPTPRDWSPWLVQLEVDLVEVEGPIVMIHLYGAFWHKREACADAWR